MEDERDYENGCHDIETQRIRVNAPCGLKLVISKKRKKKKKIFVHEDRSVFSSNPSVSHLHTYLVICLKSSPLLPLINYSTILRLRRTSFLIIINSLFPDS